MRAAELRKQCSMAPRGRSAAETVRGAVMVPVKRVVKSALRLLYTSCG